MINKTLLHHKQVSIWVQITKFESGSNEVKPIWSTFRPTTSIGKLTTGKVYDLKIFLLFSWRSLCRMRISVFWGQERLTDRSISKRYLKSHIATWVEKKKTTSRAIHARDTGFYWSSENALHERFIASSGIGVWMKMLQLIARKKH